MEDPSQWTRQKCAEWLDSLAAWANDDVARKKLDRCVALLRQSDMETVKQMVAECGLRYAIFSTNAQTELLINGPREKRPMSCSEVHLTFASDENGGKLLGAEGKS